MTNNSRGTETQEVSTDPAGSLYIRVV